MAVKTKTIVLSFDIGIKNLAYCCLQKESNKYNILGWENVNLLDDGEATKEAPATCHYCKVKPKFTQGTKKVCGRHCTGLLQPLKDASGTLYKKLPKLVTLQEILLTKHNIKVPLKGDRINEEIAKYYALPIVEAKKASAKTFPLDKLHDAIRCLVKKHSEQWHTCTLICIENQPAFKNPHMKSVQMVLYTTIRDLLQPYPPQIQLVHAGKKVQGKEKGDAGYKDRKAGSEKRAVKFLEEVSYIEPQWHQVYTAAKKKNDLADALCMSIDAIASYLKNED